jgi:hypothetical protein
VGIADEDLLLEFADDEEALAWAQATLAKFGDAFRYQLIMALHFEHQAAHLEELRAGGQLGKLGEERYMEGYVEALRHIAANLQSGDYLPGGSAHDGTVEGAAF